MQCDNSGKTKRQMQLSHAVIRQAPAAFFNYSVTSKLALLKLMGIQATPERNPVKMKFQLNDLTGRHLQEQQFISTKLKDIKL